MNSKNRLKTLREEKGLSQKEVAKLIGVNRTTYLKWENGDNQPSRKLNELCSFFNVSIDYLLGKSNLRLSNEIPAPYETQKVPIIGTVKCGADGFAYEYMDGYVMIDDSIHGDIRAFHCKGDSMTGVGINDGDIAIVRIQLNIKNKPRKMRGCFYHCAAVYIILPAFIFLLFLINTFPSHRPA